MTIQFEKEITSQSTPVEIEAYCSIVRRMTDYYEQLSPQEMVDFLSNEENEPRAYHVVFENGAQGSLSFKKTSSGLHRIFHAACIGFESADQVCLSFWSWMIGKFRSIGSNGFVVVSYGSNYYNDYVFGCAIDRIFSNEGELASMVNGIQDESISVTQIKQEDSFFYKNIVNLG